MEDEEGVAGRMFSALSAEKVNVHMITTSEIKISALVSRADAPRAVAAVHAAFGLETPTPGEAVDAEDHGPKPSALEVVRPVRSRQLRIPAPTAPADRHRNHDPCWSPRPRI
jgi:hypothetical protein